MTVECARECERCVILAITTKADLLSLDINEAGEVVECAPHASARRVTFPSAVVGHVGDGNFHVIMMLDGSSPDELRLAGAINTRMVHRAIAMEGTCTGEHGVGVGKKEYMELEHGRPAMDLMRQIKRAIDPHHIMNPGKIFDQTFTPAHSCVLEGTAGEQAHGAAIKPTPLTKHNQPACCSS